MLPRGGSIRAGIAPHTGEVLAAAIITGGHLNEMKNNLMKEGN
jgi:hypothetical protein